MDILIFKKSENQGFDYTYDPIGTYSGTNAVKSVHSLVKTHRNLVEISGILGKILRKPVEMHLNVGEIQRDLIVFHRNLSYSN
ncbi:unnamed protein product [Adineta ricciae]|uniref:Uncharacterized protein n=1 Tax=Adineta ricciae TaxID=249248 RepID=A0A815LF75_ADIRI|nr:unnamed protein product [Adineta ricciae]CAF1402523.1 unnamed protein product [Adineta ricciae]